jgi:hypothetical protein
MAKTGFSVPDFLFSNKITGLLALYFRSEVFSCPNLKKVITSLSPDRSENTFLDEAQKKRVFLKVLETAHGNMISYSQAGGPFTRSRNIYFDTPKPINVISRVLGRALI